MDDRDERELARVVAVIDWLQPHMWLCTTAVFLVFLLISPADGSYEWIIPGTALRTILMVATALSVFATTISHIRNFHHAELKSVLEAKRLNELIKIKATFFNGLSIAGFIGIFLTKTSRETGLSGDQLITAVALAITMHLTAASLVGNLKNEDAKAYPEVDDAVPEMPNASPG